MVNIIDIRIRYEKYLIYFYNIICFMFCSKIEDGKFKEEVSDKKIVFRILLSLIFIRLFFHKR